STPPRTPPAIAPTPLPSPFFSTWRIDSTTPQLGQPADGGEGVPGAVLDGFCAVAVTDQSARANSAWASFNMCLIVISSKAVRVVDYSKGRSSWNYDNRHHDEVHRAGPA